MSPIRLKDLGPKARAQVEAQTGTRLPGTGKRDRRSAGGKVTGTCRCGARITSQAELDRHPFGVDHVIFRADLEVRR